MLLRRYRLAPRSRLVESGGKKYLLCNHPLQIIELNETAWLLLRALDGATPIHDLVAGLDRPTLAYLERMVHRGVLAGEYEAAAPETLPRVRVIVPAHGRPQALSRCLRGLLELDYPASKLEIVVVDDGSPEPLRDVTNLPQNGAGGIVWIRLDSNHGAASARNAAAITDRDSAGSDGAPQVFAFIDSDCVPHPSWLRELAAVLDDPWIDAAGGATRNLHPAGLLGRYEDACASLYLGPTAGSVAGEGSPRPYLPSCNFAVKAGAFGDVGGFQSGWRVGEDVDLSWRLHEKGYGLFYWPGAIVRHEYRTAWLAFLGRKRDYARSEGPLCSRYPRRFRRVPGAWAVRGELFVFAAASLAGGPVPMGWAAAAVTAVELAKAGRRISRWPKGAPRPGSGGFAAALTRTALAVWIQECRLLVRNTLSFWPVVLAFLPPLAGVAGLIFIAGVAGEWLAKRPPIPLPPFAAGFTGECLAYSMGRIEGRIAAWWRGQRRIPRCLPPRDECA